MAFQYTLEENNSGENKLEESLHSLPFWERGRMLGKGCFGTVFQAKMYEKPSPVYGTSHIREFHSLMAVKTAIISDSNELVNEKKILDIFEDCPNIINCYGDDTTIEYEYDGQQTVFYNIFLEYAAGGTLADYIEYYSPSYDESEEAKRYLKSILMGLVCIHEKGFAHCDLHTKNVLLVKEKEDDEFYVAKICDFGLSKKTNIWIPPDESRHEFSAHDIISENDFREQQSDILEFGDIVFYMLTKQSVWSENLSHCISEEAKDFIFKCFEVNPLKRTTAKRLLSHPFLVEKKMIEN